MVRSKVTYPNVHVSQRVFWHTSRSQSLLHHVGQQIPTKCLFPSPFYSSPQQVWSLLSLVFTWITLEVFQRFWLWCARPAKTSSNKQGNLSQACPLPHICIHTGHPLCLPLGCQTMGAVARVVTGSPRNRDLGFGSQTYIRIMLKIQNCGWDFQVGMARELRVGEGEDINCISS